MMLDRLREKNLDRWLAEYATQRVRQLATPQVRGTRHLVFAFCDHYEPLWGKADVSTGVQRVQRWLEDYPRMTEPYRDAHGRPPQHTFFFPGEEYRPEFFDRLDDLVRQKAGEVELHLHHDGSTRAQMRSELLRYLDIYAQRGHLARDEAGRIRYAFIHGNWALGNGRPDGRYCGVEGEIPLLWETGCYADFTFPSAPDVTQPTIINQIYWPDGDLNRRRAYEKGIRARVGSAFTDRILIMQGPLAIARRERVPFVGIDNAAVTAANPGTARRIRTWTRTHVHVAGRPEWVFVKVHTHGAPEAQASSLLGQGGRLLHAELCTRYNDGIRWVLHYVTAREMYNIAMAAMAGKTGNPHDYRDFVLAPPPIRQAS